MKQWQISSVLSGILVILTLVSVNPASAVLCLGSDDLTGPCCSAAALNIPSSLPGTSLPSVGICWNACVPSTDPITVDFSPPAPTGCGQFQIQMTITDVGGTVLMTGLGTLIYTRTWTEFNNDGDELQIWRMMIKTDLMPSVSTPPCPVPICLATVPSAFFYGHIDYAFNCIDGTWEVATSLFHSCDRFIHHPTASSIPGTYHPGIAYAIVGPDVADNPFVPTILPPFTGPITGGAIREITVPPMACMTEDPLVTGSLGINLQGCACPFSLSPAQYATQPFSAIGSCGGNLSSILTPPPYWWKHMITTSLGTWTGVGLGTPYPGNENLWANEGFFFVTEGCTGIIRIECHYGVMTDQGFPVTPDTARPWQTMRMLDLVSNWDSSGGIIPPFVGETMRPSHTIIANF